jgi:hypothetical protein
MTVAGGTSEAGVFVAVAVGVVIGEIEGIARNRANVLSGVPASTLNRLAVTEVIVPRAIFATRCGR